MRHEIEPGPNSPAASAAAVIGRPLPACPGVDAVR